MEVKATVVDIIEQKRLCSSMVIKETKETGILNAETEWEPSQSIEDGGEPRKRWIDCLYKSGYEQMQTSIRKHWR